MVVYSIDAVDHYRTRQEFMEDFTSDSTKEQQNENITDPNWETEATQESQSAFYDSEMPSLGKTAEGNSKNGYIMLSEKATTTSASSDVEKALDHTAEDPTEAGKALTTAKGSTDRLGGVTPDTTAGPEVQATQKQSAATQITQATIMKSQAKKLEPSYQSESQVSLSLSPAPKETQETACTSLYIGTIPTISPPSEQTPPTTPTEPTQIDPIGGSPKKGHS